MSAGLDILDKNDLFKITHRKVYKAQCKVLANLGIDLLREAHESLKKRLDGDGAHYERQ